MEKFHATATDAVAGPAVSSSEMQWRLVSYGASALAITGLLAMPADAKVISYTAPANLDATNGSPILFDFLTGTAVNSSAGPSSGVFELSFQSRFSTHTGSGINYSNRQAIAVARGNTGGLSNVAGLLGSAYHLGNNTPISGGLSFGTRERLFTGTFFYRSGAFTHSSQFGDWNKNGDKGYLGFEFDNGGTEDFGWANVTVNSNSTLTLNSFGYDNTGAPIDAGERGTSGGAAAPDANPLLLLVVGGATAMAAYRKRRRESAFAA